MIKIYTICMGNYYRSRLAEELLLYYAPIFSLSISTDSGGLDKIPNPNNKGRAGPDVYRYLSDRNIQPKKLNRYPQNVKKEHLEEADYIICTYKKEQKELFEKKFPEHKMNIIYWEVPDTHEDPNLKGPDLINNEVIKFLTELSKLSDKNEDI